MSLFYLDKENRIIPIPFGKDGDALRMVNGVPKFIPDTATPPVEPPFVLKVNAGPDVKLKAGAPVVLTLTATAEKATSFLWKVIKVPSTGLPTPVAIYIVTGTGNDATVDGSKFVPGMLILLVGTFKSLWFSNLNGSAELPIIIQNQGKVLIGDRLWAGTGRGAALRMANCHNFKILCTNNGDIEISGSTATTLSPGNEQWRAHYRNIDMTEFTDNFEIFGVISNNGGHGIVAKTDVIANNSATYDSTPLGTMVFRNMAFNNNWNEAMYIGHTATMWNIKTGKPEYSIPSGPDLKEPLRISHVVVMDSKISGCGLDGIQIAATDEVDITGNEVTNWATQKKGDHQGGILIGGKVRSSETHGNWIHDGYGEVIQFYAQGGFGAHSIKGNLGQNNQGDMVSVRGSNGALVTIEDNIFLDAGPNGNLIRINGTTNGPVKQAIIKNNILAGPLNNGIGTVYPKNYIYTENGPANMVEELGNKKFLNIAAAGALDLSVKEKAGPKPTAVPGSLVIKSPTAAATEVSGLVAGEYIFEVTAKYQDQIAIDTVTVTVE